MGVISNLVSVHYGSRYLYCADEVKKVVAQMISELFHLFLRHVCPVGNNVVVHGKSGSNSSPVCNHVKVKASLLTIVLNQPFVNDSAWSWVLILIVVFLCKPSIDSFVN